MQGIHPAALYRLVEDGRTLPGNLRNRLESAFGRGTGHGLLELGIREVVRRCHRILLIGEILQSRIVQITR
jgi:hypothetical protein